MGRIGAIGIRLVAAGALGLANVRARAETSANFQVGATVESGCLIEGPGASGGNFGTLDFGSASALSTETRTATLANAATLTLRCTPQTMLSMTIDAGQHVGGGLRHLQRGGDVTSRIVYALCSDAACVQPILIAQPVAIAVTTANADDVRLPIFGRLTLPGNLPAGLYADTLTLVLSW